MTRKNNALNGTSQASDRILSQLEFLSEYFGKAVEPSQITSNVPLPDGRITERELEECATRAGLEVAECDRPIRALKRTMLPVLGVSEDGHAVTLVDYNDGHFECCYPGIPGTSWVSPDELKLEQLERWYFIRPIVYFDKRSLLYHLPDPKRWFWDTLKSNRGIYAWALLGTIVINLFGAVIPFFTMAVYDRVVPNNALSSLWVLASAAVIVVLFDFAIKVTRSHLVDAASRRVDIALSSRIFSQALRLRASNRPASGGVLANIVRDFDSVRDFFTSTTLTVLGDMPFVLFFIAIIALVAGPLALVPIALIPLALGSALLLRKPMNRILENNAQAGSQRTAHLFEVMNGLDTVKCVGAESWARRKWEMLTVTLSGDSVRLRGLAALGNYISSSLTSLTTVLMVTFGALLIAANELTLGQLIAASMLSSRAVAPISQLAGIIVRWQQTKIALEALNQVMEAPTDDEEGKLHLPAIRGQVELRDVSFGYPGSTPLLNGMNLRINPGEKLAFIGRIGSGKSTVLKLLLNLYQPEKGTVMVDNIPVSHVDPHNLRRQIGYVPQDVVLFHGDIRENILMGATDISDADLLEAIHIACLEPTLAQLPDGLNTQVGERGERLSGGQRQAIGIARALVRKPKLLLMDEPSSMIDPGTENQLIQNLRTYLNETTLILVTHRMAMLPMVDRLVVFDQGRITADGPRDLVLERLAAAQSGRQQAAQPKASVPQQSTATAAVVEQPQTRKNDAAATEQNDRAAADKEKAKREKRAKLLAAVARKDRLIRQRIKAAKKRKQQLPQGREKRLALAKRKIEKMKKARQAASTTTHTIDQQGALGA